MTDEPRICFAIVCHNFERRLAWQLSSLAQQVDAPGLLIHIATMAPNDVQRVVDWTLPKSRHHAFVYEYAANDSDEFAYRSIVRNRQIDFALERNYDWIYFADCDLVYHPQFFCELAKFLTGEGAEVDKCIYSRSKWCTELTATEKMLDKNMRKRSFIGCYMEDAFDKVAALPHRRERKAQKNVAWGGCQIVKLSAIVEKNEGRYSVRPDSCGDSHLFRSGQLARGDRGFRSALGQHHYMLPPQVHVEHRRDKEAGFHLEEQR